jgi:hypothetical protein
MFKKVRAVMSVEHIIQIVVSALVFAALMIPLTDTIIGANYSGAGAAANITGVTKILYLLLPFLIVVAFIVMLTKEV